MDRKVVSTNTMHTLEGIANIAAFLTMETDLYVGLGMAVEMYMEDQSTDNFNNMHAAFTKCINRYPVFHNARHGQIELLIKHGSLVAPTTRDGDMEIYEHQEILTESLEQGNKTSTNVVQFKNNNNLK
jgi:hypothetical protein